MKPDCPLAIFSIHEDRIPQAKLVVFAVFTLVRRVSRVRSPWPPARCRRLITQNTMHVHYYYYQTRERACCERGRGTCWRGRSVMLWAGWMRHQRHGRSVPWCHDSIALRLLSISHQQPPTPFEFC